MRDCREFLGRLLSGRGVLGRGKIRINGSGIAHANLPGSLFRGGGTPQRGDVLVACWDEERGEVTVAGYEISSGRCYYLWRGELSERGIEEAYRSLLEEGLPLQAPTGISQKSPPVPVLSVPVPVLSGSIPLPVSVPSISLPVLSPSVPVSGAEASLPELEGDVLDLFGF
jgi:hypothetical protein